MGKVNVEILNPAGISEKAALPDDAPIKNIVKKLIQMMKLPTTDPTGQPMSYKFHHKASGKQLSEDQTLAQAGVKDGDVLRLQPEIVAG